MLEGYGIHALIWDAADERLGEWLVASPADATGRGIELHLRQGGAAVDPTDASVYFIWRHKKTGVRGCEPFEEIDESFGQFMVYCPAAMCEEEGVVDAQCTVSWDDKSISMRAFTIHVEPVIIGGTESEDGFMLFVETIKRYEDVIEISSDAVDAVNEAAEAAEDAADIVSGLSGDLGCCPTQRLRRRRWFQPYGHRNADCRGCDNHHYRQERHDHGQRRKGCEGRHWCDQCPGTEGRQG